VAPVAAHDDATLGSAARDDTMTKTEQHSENEQKGEELWLPCEKCVGEKQHVVRASIDVSDNNEKYDMHVSQSFQIVECCGCRWLSFRHEWSDSEDVEVDEDSGAERPIVHETIYPGRLADQKPLDDYGLPAKVRAIYREAHFALRNQQPILAAIGIRALVEAVCAEKKAAGRDLEKRIDELVSLGVLTRAGADILHGTRLLGNKAAHETLPPTEAQLGAAIQVSENLLQSVYILPRIAAGLPKKKGTP
jgi:hypothetical protein